VVRQRALDLWRGSDDLGYGVVLGLIALTYAASVTLSSSTAWTAFVLVLQVVVVLIVLRISHARRAVRAIGTVTVLAALVIAVLAVITKPESHAGSAEQSPTLIGLLWLSALLYGIAPLSILRHQLTRPTIDMQTLLAAIAAYLMIGMFFAFSYRAIAEVSSTPFFGSSGPGTVADDLFFSFITLTTTGYGNLVPAGNPGQTFAVAEAIVGQLFLVTAVAKIVNESGLLTARANRERAAAVEADKN
jgi:Ion channel